MDVENNVNNTFVDDTCEKVASFEFCSSDDCNVMMNPTPNLCYVGWNIHTESGVDSFDT